MGHLASIKGNRHFEQVPGHAYPVLHDIAFKIVLTAEVSLLKQPMTT